MGFLLKHKLIAAGITVMVAGVAWYFLSGSSGSGAVLSTEAPTVPPEAQQLILSLATLRAVKLDGAIFANPSFKALVDFSTPITTEPIGRQNPFAPLSASEISSGAAALPAPAPVTHSTSGQ